MKYKEVVISNETIPSLPEQLPIGSQIFAYDRSKEGKWSNFTVGESRFLVEGIPRDDLYHWAWEDVKIRIPLDEIDSSNYYSSSYWASQYCSTDELNTWIKNNNAEKITLTNVYLLILDLYQKYGDKKCIV